jgi:hypothetical protein
MMTFLLRGRNESAVYFEQQLDLSKSLPWLDAHETKLFPLILHALAATLHDRDRLNRFTLGRRTYQRNGVFLSFAAKKSMSDDAPLATVKRRFERDETFATLCKALGGEVTREYTQLPMRAVRVPADAVAALSQRANIVANVPDAPVMFLAQSSAQQTARLPAPTSP